MPILENILRSKPAICIKCGDRFYIHKECRHTSKQYRNQPIVPASYSYSRYAWHCDTCDMVYESARRDIFGKGRAKCLKCESNLSYRPVDEKKGKH